MTDQLKIPPWSLEAEQALIGSVLISPTCYSEAEFIQPEDFYNHDHATLWRLIRADENNRDMVALMTQCQTVDERVYLGDLARNVPSAANVKHYAHIVRERAVLRRLIRAFNDASSSIFDGQSSANVIAGTIREIERIGDGAVIGEGPRHISDLSSQWFDDYKSRATNHGIVGISTGFRDLDERWGGLRGGQVVVLAGRPKTGKSTLALNIAENVSRDNPVAVFQMEMSESEMIDRTVSSISRVPLKSIRNGTADSTDDFGLLLDAFNRMRSSRLYVDATPRQTINYIRMHCKAFVKRHGKGLIVIDYLGLIRSDSMARSKNDEIGEISRDIKLLAKETDCPVLLLCQMNRNVEKEKRKPVLSDLRDSGSIEQDADVICFTHKDEEDQGYSEIITRAMRSGQAGTDYLMCRFDVSQFVDAPEGFVPDSHTRKSKGPSFAAGRRSSKPTNGRKDWQE